MSINISFDSTFFKFFNVVSLDKLSDKQGRLYDRHQLTQLFFEKVKNFTALCQTSNDMKQLHSECVQLLHASYVLRQKDDDVLAKWRGRMKTCENILKNRTAIRSVGAESMIGCERESLAAFIYSDFYEVFCEEKMRIFNLLCNDIPLLGLLDMEMQCDMVEIVKKMPFEQIHAQSLISILSWLLECKNGYQRGCIIYTLGQFEPSRLSTEMIKHIILLFHSCDDYISLTDTMRSCLEVPRDVLTGKLIKEVKSITELLTGIDSVGFRVLVRLYKVIQGIPEPKRDLALSYALEILRHEPTQQSVWRYSYLQQKDRLSDQFNIPQWLLATDSITRRIELLKAVQIDLDTICEQSRGKYLSSAISKLDAITCTGLSVNSFFGDLDHEVEAHQLKTVAASACSELLDTTKKHPIMTILNELTDGPKKQWFSTIAPLFKQISNLKHAQAAIKAVFLIPEIMRTDENIKFVVQLFTLDPSDPDEELIVANIEKIAADERMEKITFLAAQRPLLKAKDQAVMLSAFANIRGENFVSIIARAITFIKPGMSAVEMAAIFKKLSERAPDEGTSFIPKQTTNGFPNKITARVNKKFLEASSNKPEMHQTTSIQKKLESVKLTQDNTKLSTAKVKKKSVEASLSKPALHLTPNIHNNLELVKLTQDNTKLNKEEYVEEKVDALLRKRHQLNVTASLKGRESLIVMQDVQEEKFQSLSKIFKAYCPSLLQIKQKKKRVYDLIITSRGVGALHALFDNKKFLNALDEMKAIENPQPTQKLNHCSPPTCLVEPNWDHWMQELKRLTFGAKINREGEALIVDFTELSIRPDCYSLAIKPAKASLKDVYPPTEVDAATLREQVISRLIRGLDLKQIDVEGEHRFAFLVRENEPDHNSCLGLHETLADHFVKLSPALKKSTMNIVFNQPEKVIDVPLLPKPPISVRERLIHFIGHITGETANGFSWLLRENHKRKELVSWNVKGVPVINLNGQTVKTKDFFGWLCQSLTLFKPGAMTFIDFHEGNKSGVRIDSACLPLLEDRSVLERLRQDFAKWAQGLQTSLVEDSLVEYVKDKSTPPSNVGGIERQLLLPPLLPEWDTLSCVLDPSDPIKVHVEQLFLLAQSGSKMVDMAQFRKWHLHLFRFIHLLRDRYQRNTRFLTDFRTVMRHNTFRVDWEKNEKLLSDIVLGGLHIIVSGWDQYASDFQARVVAFSELHCKSLDHVNEADIEERLIAEKQQLHQFLAQKSPCKTAVVMTVAIIGKLIQLQRSKQQELDPFEKKKELNPFEKLCTGIRAELGHLEAFANDYFTWEDNTFTKVLENLQ